MSIAICTTKCTKGQPARLYQVGDKLSYVGECPKYFQPVVSAAPVAPEPEIPEKGKTLSQVSGVKKKSAKE